MIRDAPKALPPPREDSRSALGLPGHFSFSAMQQFQACPRKWFYAYLARAPRERQPCSLLFGAALHEALAYLHMSRKQGKGADLATLEDAFRSQWSRIAVEAEVCYGKTESKEDLFRIAGELLKLALEAPQEQVRILAVERPVHLNLSSLSVPIVGRADLIVEVDGVVWLIDLKTSRNTLSADQIAQGGAQLALYTAALQTEDLPFRVPSRARLQILRKLKKPKLETVEVDIGVASLERAKRMLSDTWRLIEAAASCGAFPAKPGWACTTCPFRDRCQKETSEVPSPARKQVWDAPAARTVPAEEAPSGIAFVVRALIRLFSR